MVNISILGPITLFILIPIVGYFLGEMLRSKYPTDTATYWKIIFVISGVISLIFLIMDKAKEKYDDN